MGGTDGMCCKINVPMKLEIQTFTRCSQILSVNETKGKPQNNLYLTNWIEE